MRYGEAVGRARGEALGRAFASSSAPEVNLNTNLESDYQGRRFETVDAPTLSSVGSGSDWCAIAGLPAGAVERG